MGIWPDLHKGQLGTICPRSSSLSIFKGKAPLHFKHRQLSVILFFRPFRYLEKPYEPYFFGLNFALFSYVTAE